MSNRWDLMRVSLARRFYGATLLQAAAVILFGTGLALIFGRQEPSAHIRLPWAFAVSTVFLGIGSFYLEKAHSMVRRERQLEFRESLTKAFVFAMLFVSVQGYGLWAIDKGARTAENAQVGVHGFLVMLTALHGMHFIVAQSVLLWVKLSSAADRYDHEYYWGVTFAKWFWHILGIVWIAILFVFTMSFASR